MNYKYENTGTTLYKARIHPLFEWLALLQTMWLLLVIPAAVLMPLLRHEQVSWERLTVAGLLLFIVAFYGFIDHRFHTIGITATSVINANSGRILADIRTIASVAVSTHGVDLKLGTGKVTVLLTDQKVQALSGVINPYRFVEELIKAKQAASVVLSPEVLAEITATAVNTMAEEFQPAKPVLPVAEASVAIKSCFMESYFKKNATTSRRSPRNL